MLFSGGIAPHILVMNALGLIDTIWALILPSVVMVYYMLLLKGFFEGVPEELEESAKLDGARNMDIFFKIYMPMSAPMVATVGFLRRSAIGIILIIPFYMLLLTNRFIRYQCISRILWG